MCITGGLGISGTRKEQSTSRNAFVSLYFIVELIIKLRNLKPLRSEKGTPGQPPLPSNQYTGYFRA